MYLPGLSSNFDYSSKLGYAKRNHAYFGIAFMLFFYESSGESN